MKTVIKYCAILFALLLAGSIISGCVNAGVMVVRAIADKSGGEIKIDGEVVLDTDEWFSDESFGEVNGGFRMFGIQFGGTRETKSGTYQVTGPVHEIFVDGVPGEVEIKRGNEFCVTYQNIPVEYRMEVRDGKLILKDESKSIVVIGINITEHPYLCLTVPENVELTKLTVDNGSGKLTVSNISPEKLELDGGSGSMTVMNAVVKSLLVDGGSGMVQLTNVTAETSNFDMGSGGFKVAEAALGSARLNSGSGSCVFEKTSAHNLSVDSGSGRVIYEGDLTGNCIFDSGSGIIRLFLAGKEEDYAIRASLGSGGLYINGNKEGRSGYYESRNNSVHSLIFNSGSGSVHVKFSE